MDIPEDHDVFVPDDVVGETKESTFHLLPSRSKERYEKEFRKFDEWRKGENVCGLNEDVVLAYFHAIEKTCKASSLWTRYSMLKSTLKAYEDVDISRFFMVTNYLKGKARTHTAKKAKTLEKVHIEQFLVEAPDTLYLLMKVALIMGIAGACRCEELTKLSVDDIENKGSYLLVTLPDTETNKVRKFIVIDDGFGVNVLDTYKKYASLRPNNVYHRRFFLNYKKEKCTTQPVGINTLSRVPKEIATYLKLPEPETYTGHSFRRSSASLLANTGGNTSTFKRFGGWKSSSVAEGPIEDSAPNKLEITKKIMKEEISSEFPDETITGQFTGIYFQD